MKEEHASAKKRTVLEKLLQDLRIGDILVVSKLFVLADSTRHLVEVLDDLEKKEAYLLSVHDRIDTRTAAGRTFRANAHSLLGLQKDSKAGRPRKMDDNVKKAIQMYESKQYSLAQIKEQTGISKTTLYRYLEN
ncbi:recombinase family protein [Saccharibacillus endophyticus]|uniref:Resolvase n=1 Tax=Saccharibacillus endophyticus TaxID=2060666 RepID=A0ABQ1ZJC4_9BACL|nr:recombinase family protein [Saccharibacillus endophyticus]GGH67673.1 resolvase [Saccharibacillus endophyticus]